MRTHTAVALTLASPSVPWIRAQATPPSQTALAEAGADRIGNSIVQVFATRRGPDFTK